MSDRNDPKKGDLILSGNRSLAIRRLDLVKRGLELVQELKKRHLEVVIGDHGGVGGVFSELLSAYIQEVIENKYDLKVRTFFYGEELLEQVENGAVDILILMINNIRFRHDDPPRRRIQASLQLLAKIKTIYHVPVIALSGSIYPSLVRQGRLIAGSDFFFSVPFEADAFMEAIKKCLDMLPGFAEVSRKRIKGSAGHNIA
jgi:DNA-binding NarL/FixJ family response regulator